MSAPGSALHPTPQAPQILRLPWAANAYVVRTPAGTLLVDTGALYDAPALSALAARAAEEGAALSAVFLTHHHLDHAGGAWLAARLGLPVICPEGEVDALVRAAPAWMGQSRGARFAPPVPKSALEPVRAGQRVLGHEVLALPGHTHGQLGLRLSHHLGVIAADAVLERGGKALAPWARLNQDHAQALRTLEEMSRWPDQIYWPGHGEALTRAQLQARAARIRR